MWLFRPFADGQAGQEIVVTPTHSCLPTKEGACDAVVVVVVVVVYLKRLRIVLRCAKAGCGRRTSSS